MPTKLNRDTIARQFLYETGMFDNSAEIKANPDHRLVVVAYRAADRILAMLASAALTGDDRDRLQAELDGVRAALKPFAGMQLVCPEDNDEVIALYISNGDVASIRNGNIKRARAALSPTESREPKGLGS